MRLLQVGLIVVLVACANGRSASVELPENYREQLHAVTGHEPSECTDLRGVEPMIEITSEGFVPDCAIVDADQDVTITNRQEIPDTWIIADPPTELELARHARLVLELAPSETAVVDSIGERVSTGVWICYGRESRHQCQIVVMAP